MGYPYLVVRLLPAVYPRREIRFGPAGAPRLLGPLYVEVDEPYRDGRLTGRACRALVRACVVEARRTRRRMCLMLDASRSVYIEADGSVSLDERLPRSNAEELLASLVSGE